MCWVLGHILESHHDFRIPSGYKKLWSLRVPASPGIPDIPGIPGMPPPIPGLSPGKLPGIPPGKLPGKEPQSTGCFVRSLARSSRASYTFSIILSLSLQVSPHTSSDFSKCLSPRLDLFQPFTGILVITQFTGKARSWAAPSSQGPRSLCVFTLISVAELNQGLFSVTVVTSEGSIWLL